MYMHKCICVSEGLLFSTRPTYAEACLAQFVLCKSKWQSHFLFCVKNTWDLSRECCFFFRALAWDLAFGVSRFIFIVGEILIGDLDSMSFGLPWELGLNTSLEKFRLIAIIVVC